MYYNHFKLAEGTDLLALNKAINEHVRKISRKSLDPGGSWTVLTACTCTVKTRAL